MKAISTEDQSSLKTIDIQQSLISRMSSQSSTMKSWCVTAVTAIIAIAFERSSSRLVIVAAIPTLMFASLDIYYLSLERVFRKWHIGFCKKLNEGSATSSDLFQVGPSDLSFGDTLSAAASRSIWPFYLLIGIAVSAVACWIQ